MRATLPIAHQHPPSLTLPRPLPPAPLARYRCHFRVPRAAALCKLLVPPAPITLGRCAPLCFRLSGRYPPERVGRSDPGGSKHSCRSNQGARFALPPKNKGGRRLFYRLAASTKSLRAHSLPVPDVAPAAGCHPMRATLPATRGSRRPHLPPHSAAPHPKKQKRPPVVLPAHRLN